MGSVLFEITVIICIAAFLAVIFRFFKQPAILAYILTGILIGPFGQIQLGHLDQLKNLAQLGITLLLFMMGLEFRLRDLRSIGFTAGIIGAGQIVITWICGYFIAIALGFNPTSAIYVGIALTFSSTIVIVKLLSDKKNLQSLYGKISVGLLLAQDITAVFILMFLSKASSGEVGAFLPLPLALVLVKGILIFGSILYLGKVFFPKIVHIIARSEETLFLFSLAWVLGLAGLVASPLVGFPIEIGGFLAGLALANSLENLQIAARIKTLRDFFITIFFVMIGMEMTFGNFSAVIVPALVLSLFVIFVKPFIVMCLMGVLGYRKRTSFLTGIVTSQISEFSLIILFLGATLGHITPDVLSVITVVSVVTFVVSTYLIVYDNKIYLTYGHHFAFFERKIRREGHIETQDELGEHKNHVVLVGSNRMGESILEALRDEGEDVVVVDFDPDVVDRLRKKKIVSLFGDIADIEIQERAQLLGAKLVISTVPDVDDNLILLRNLSGKRNIKVVVMAKEIEDARVLYENGADYVMLPYLAGGRHLAKIIKDDTLDKLEIFKKKDAEYLI